MLLRRTLSSHMAIIVLLVVAGLVAGLSASRAGMRTVAQQDTRTVTFRQGEAGYGGCADTRISEERPNDNFANAELMVGMKGRVNTLIRFDVSSIPSNATIQEATLGLWVFNYGQRTGPIDAAAYQVFRTWKENEATWYKATNVDFWGLPGCNDTVTDRSPTPLDKKTIYNREQWYMWNVTAAVQQWVRDSTTNKGVIVHQMNIQVGGEFDISQSESSGVEDRPYLTVKYTLVPPTPTRSPTPPGPPTPAPLPCVSTPEPGSVIAVLQRGADCGATEDTWFNFDDREADSDGEWFMRVGYRRHYSGLIKYDVSCIPPGSRIVCAALSIFAERWSGGVLDIGAYYVKRPNTVSQATWTRADSLVLWQAGGCNGPDDRLQSPESMVRVHTIYTWYDLDLTRAVDGWVNGSLANNGVSLQAVDEFDTDTVWFTSSDDDDAAMRPKLVVLYVPPPGAQPTATRTRTATPTQTATPTATATATNTTLPATATATRTAVPTQPFVNSTTVTLQNGVDGYNGCMDTRISAEAANANFASSELKVGASQAIASLLRFDLSRIPTTALIQSAQLSAYGYHSEGDAAGDLAVYAVRRSWVESQATWNRASSAASWGMAGCNNTFSDRAADASDRVPAGSTGWYAWSVRDDVQRMVEEPAGNAGWLLRQATGAPAVLSLYSSEGVRVAYRPMLVITYSAP